MDVLAWREREKCEGGTMDNDTMRDVVSWKKKLFSFSSSLWLCVVGWFNIVSRAHVVRHFSVSIQDAGWDVRTTLNVSTLFCKVNTDDFVIYRHFSLTKLSTGNFLREREGDIRWTFLSDREIWILVHEKDRVGIKFMNLREKRCKTKLITSSCFFIFFFFSWIFLQRVNHPKFFFMGFTMLLSPGGCFSPRYYIWRTCENVKLR